MITIITAKINKLNCQDKQTINKFRANVKYIMTRLQDILTFKDLFII